MKEFFPENNFNFSSFLSFFFLHRTTNRLNTKLGFLDRSLEKEFLVPGFERGSKVSKFLKNNSKLASIDLKDDFSDNFVDL